MRKITFKSSNCAGDGLGVLLGDPAVWRRGVIVLHEWWGLTRQIEEEAQLIASQGQMTALVVDVYRGRVAKDREQAGHFMEDLDWDGAVKDISGAAKYLLDAGCRKVLSVLSFS